MRRFPPREKPFKMNSRISRISRISRRRMVRDHRTMQTVDVGHVLDEGQWTTYQKLLILATALTIVLDGVDNQLLGNAIPSLMKEWSLSRGAFSTVLALSPLGMMFGGALGGLLGDRIGRRAALLGSVVSFAALTLAISMANGLLVLGVLRFFAGLGLGGAMP